MTAGYLAIDDETLNRLTDLDEDELTEALEELAEQPSGPQADLDKMWDGLHFLLTGESASDPIEDDPLSEAVVGVDALSEEDFVGAVPGERVAALATALEQVNIEELLSAADFSAFEAADLYPEIWTDDPAQLRKELRQAFTELRGFYRAAQAGGHNVVVSIW